MGLDLKKLIYIRSILSYTPSPNMSIYLPEWVSHDSECILQEKLSFDYFVGLDLKKIIYILVTIWVTPP